AAGAIADPATVLATRTEAVGAALLRLLGPLATGPEIAEAAELARRAALAAPDVAGALGRANVALPWPTEPHLVLWHATTLLRELRGDGHIAALVRAGLDPVESLVSFAGVGAAPVEVFASRGWTPEEWAAASEQLRERGLVDPTGAATPDGHAVREKVEQS